jgi:hypothetical protein
MPKFFVVRVNRDRDDTHAATSLDRALELANPDADDALQVGVVEAKDAGAARLLDVTKWRKIQPVRLGRLGRRGNPFDDESDVGVVARTLFVTAWADWAEENGESLRGELFDLAPETPPEAEECAAGLIERVELLNDASWEELYKRAKATPGKHLRKPTPEDFAYCLTMEMLGHGVSWSDDHPEVDIKLPRVETHWDGEELFCSTSGGRNPARRRR